ncbi:MAG: hypothetical protein OXH76_24415 [Boseongicola sp.]|nr:hypothetical protein [Boseongicola sp.]
MILPLDSEHSRALLIKENEIPPLPAEWDVQRFRFYFRESKERNGITPIGNMLSVSEYRGVVPKEYEHEERRRTDEELQTYRVVRPGQLAVNTMWLNHLALGVSDYLGHVSPAYAVYQISPRLNARFAHHLLRSQFYLKVYLRYLYGIRPNSFQIKSDDWNSIPVIVPPPSTQKTIADFLDRETAQIDRLIEKKQRLAKVLKERLQSELEQLTTPKEPSQCELVPFRWICRITEGQVDPTTPEWIDKPLIAPNHIESGTGRLIAVETAREQGAISGKYAFSAGTVVYSKIRPNLAKACVSPFAGMCSADMYPILPDKLFRPKFLLMQLLSAKFSDWATLESMRVAMPKINRETFGAYRFWVPNTCAQDKAVGAFSIVQEQVEELSDKISASIDHMREFRCALITAAVTGQIDVTTWRTLGRTERHLDQIEGGGVT